MSEGCTLLTCKQEAHGAQRCPATIAHPVTGGWQWGTGHHPAHPASVRTSGTGITTSLHQHRDLPGSPWDRQQLCVAAGLPERANIPLSQGKIQADGKDQTQLWSLGAGGLSSGLSLSSALGQEVAGGSRGTQGWLQGCSSHGT